MHCVQMSFSLKCFKKTHVEIISYNADGKTRVTSIKRCRRQFNMSISCIIFDYLSIHFEVKFIWHTNLIIALLDVVKIYIKKCEKRQIFISFFVYFIRAVSHIKLAEISFYRKGCKTKIKHTFNKKIYHFYCYFARWTI